MPASPEAVELVEEQGGKLCRHQSQPLTARMLTQADYVFTMTRAHRATIVQQYPELGARVHTVSADGTDVSDPIGQGMEEYRRCLAQITDSLERILERVLS
jgi:protein-tyrosine phosphatase